MLESISRRILRFFGSGLGFVFGLYAGIGAIFGTYLGSVYGPDHIYIVAIDGFVETVFNPLTGVVGLELQKAELLASPVLWLVILPLAYLAIFLIAAAAILIGKGAGGRFGALIASIMVFFGITLGVVSCSGNIAALARTNGVGIVSLFAIASLSVLIATIAGFKTGTFVATAFIGSQANAGLKRASKEKPSADHYEEAQNDNIFTEKAKVVSDQNDVIENPASVDVIKGQIRARRLRLLGDDD